MSSESLLLALGILSASFFGSWHCGAMCGPVTSLMKAKGQLAWYHLGRLLSYTALGSLAGSAGGFFLNHDLQFLRILAAFLMAACLAWMGLRLISPETFAPSLLAQRLQQRMHLPLSHKNVLRSGLLFGFATAALPCGWLYTYVLAAATTKSPLAGAITMLLFWLGGLPILTAVPTLIKAGIASAGLRQQRVAGGILVLGSLYSLGMFFFQT